MRTEPRIPHAVARMLCLALLAATWPATNAGAQSHASLPQPGARIRLHAPELSSRPLVTMLDSLAANGLTYYRNSTVAWVPFSAIERLEVSYGRQAGTGAARGAIIGLLAGTTVVLFTADRGCSFPFSRGECMLIGSVVIGVPSMLIGALAGAVWGPERWVPVPLESATGSHGP
jgi:hypothetical protein